MDMESVVCTAVYFNPNKDQWECWIVNQVTGVKIFRGCCDATAPKRYRDEWEKEIWWGFMKELQQANEGVHHANTDHNK